MKVRFVGPNLPDPEHELSHLPSQGDIIALRDGDWCVKSGPRRWERRQPPRSSAAPIWIVVIELVQAEKKSQILTPAEAE